MGKYCDLCGTKASDIAEFNAYVLGRDWIDTGDVDICENCAMKIKRKLEEILK